MAAHAERDVVVDRELGMHARPAATLADMAARFASSVHISCHGRCVDAKSVLLVLTLDARLGDLVRIRADGPDADEAVAAIAPLIGAR